MESATKCALLGHLLITVPVILVILVVVFFGLYMFGPDLLPYYILAGLTVGWQWHSMAEPHWKTWLVNRGLSENEAENFARGAVLAWPGASTVGLFALHTTAAAVCAIHFAPWLVGRWFAWILPLAGMSTTTFAADYYLQHLEVVSILPALGLGYLMSRHFPKMGTWAWVLPTVILSYKLLTFTDPHASVLVASPSFRWSYFFVIQRYMPTLRDFRGSDPVQVAQQMCVVAPFYSGLAYSIGALAQQHKVLQKFIGSSSAMEARHALPRNGEASDPTLEQRRDEAPAVPRDG